MRVPIGLAGLEARGPGGRARGWAFPGARTFSPQQARRAWRGPCTCPSACGLGSPRSQGNPHRQGCRWHTVLRAEQALPPNAGGLGSPRSQGKARSARPLRLPLFPWRSWRETAFPRICSAIREIRPWSGGWRRRPWSLVDHERARTHGIMSCANAPAQRFPDPCVGRPRRPSVSPCLRENPHFPTTAWPLPRAKRLPSPCLLAAQRPPSAPPRLCGRSRISSCLGALVVHPLSPLRISDQKDLPGR